MHHHAARATTIAATITTLALTAATAGAVPTAQVARTRAVNETARLHLVHKSGSTLTEQGTATGTLAGDVDARLQLTVVIISGTVTIHPHGGGSLTIKVFGVPTSATVNAHATGTITITGGTGRYAHAHGTGHFTGTINRRTWAATVTATGRLTL